MKPAGKFPIKAMLPVYIVAALGAIIGVSALFLDQGKKSKYKKLYEAGFTATLVQKKIDDRIGNPILLVDTNGVKFLLNQYITSDAFEKFQVGEKFTKLPESKDATDAKGDRIQLLSDFGK